MPSREEMISFLKSQQRAESSQPSREEMISFLKSQSAEPTPAAPEGTISVPFMNKSGGIFDRKAGEPLGAGESYKVTPEGVARGAVKTLPMVGSLVGGVMGTPVAGPAGTAVGAGLGAAAGKSLQNILESYALGDEKSRKDIYLSPVKAGLDGAMAEMGGESLAAVPGFVKGVASGTKNLIAKKLGQSAEFTPIANQEAVKAAAKNIGVEDVPRGVLTDNPTFQQLESGLSQSGSLPAKAARDQYGNLFKKLQDASDKISSLKTTDSDFALGGKIQSELAENVAASREPVSKLYKDLEPNLRKISVDNSVVNKAFGALKRDPIFQTADGRAMLEEYKSAVGQQPDLASLKEFRSTLKGSLSKTASPLDETRINAIRNTVTSIRDNSINILKNELPKNLHGEVDDLIDQIALADSAHASNIKDINSVKSLVGNRDFSSPSTFVKKLSEMKEGELAQKASNLDVGTFRALKDKFPGVFEKAKSAKVNDLIQSSTNPVSGFSDARFLKQYGSLDKEMKDLLFDPAMQSHIESLSTVRQAIPPKLGPSGTPGGQMMMDMFNPKRNALDYGIKKALDATASKGTQEAMAASEAMTPAVNRVAPITQGYFRSGDKSIASAPMSKAADKTPKGKEKWANDGLQKLIDHAGPDERDVLEGAKTSADPRVKELLIQASDLKPGSKAMSDVMKKIKARANGQKVAGGE